jgi:hypothetical protein
LRACPSRRSQPGRHRPHPVAAGAESPAPARMVSVERGRAAARQRFPRGAWRRLPPDVDRPGPRHRARAGLAGWVPAAFAAAPVLLAWCISPLVAWWVSLPLVTPRSS